LASMALPSGLLAGLLNRLCRWSAGTWMIRPQCSARGAALIRLIRSSSGWRAVLRWRSPSASILVLICFAAARCWLRLPQLRGWCTAACRRPSMSLREGQRLAMLSWRRKKTGAERAGPVARLLHAVCDWTCSRSSWQVATRNLAAAREFVLLPQPCQRVPAACRAAACPTWAER